MQAPLHPALDERYWVILRKIFTAALDFK